MEEYEKDWRKSLQMPETVTMRRPMSRDSVLARGSAIMRCTSSGFPGEDIRNSKKNEPELKRVKLKQSFRIRQAPPKINLHQGEEGEGSALRDIFHGFDEFIRGMIERGEDIESEEDLYLKLLSDYLKTDKETVRKLEKIEINVDTSDQSLQAFGSALTQLLELKLNNSVIHSLRDIGTSFKSLKVLWVSRVGLRDLGGLLAFQSLEELYASYNFVSNISDINYVEKLTVLDLEGNNITDTRELTYLSSSITNLNLTGNPVAEDPNYLSTVLEYGKKLIMLDEVNVELLRENLKIDREFSLSSPKIKKRKEEHAEYTSIMDKYLKLGLPEDIIRESIDIASSLFVTEPRQDEILRQSIKSHSLAGKDKGKLLPMALSKEEKLTRPSTASSGIHRSKTELIPEIIEDFPIYNQEPQIEGYSDLASNIETPIIGNAINAAKIKKEKKKEEPQRLDIYSLIDQFKGISHTLTQKIEEKMNSQDPVRVHAQNALPQVRAPIKPNRLLTVKRIKHIKM